MAQDCDAAETTVQMDDCMAAAYARSDAALNDSYKAAMESLASDVENGAAIAGQLRSAQRAWITYRDLACAAEAALYAGGTLERSARIGCLARLTDERVTALSEFLPN